MATTAEQLAAAINYLSAEVAEVRSLVNDDALVMLLSWRVPSASRTVIRDVLRAIEELPTTCLTAQGRAIRIRED